MKKAFKAAFPSTIPILTGFLFLGMAYGIYMNALGFSPIYPALMSLLIFAGSVEFVTADLLLGAFHPLAAFLLAFMINARHLFYGISMLDRFKGVGRKKWYLIFGMCDETFSLNYTAKIPEDVEKGWFMFWVTFLNQMYWFLGATTGAICGSFLHFDTKGLDFVMTALFVVIFLENWLNETNHVSAILGLGISLIALIIFKGNNFIIPSMIGILFLLSVLKTPLHLDRASQSSEDKIQKLEEIERLEGQQ